MALTTWSIDEVLMEGEVQSRAQTAATTELNSVFRDCCFSLAFGAVYRRAIIPLPAQLSAS